MAKCEKCGQEIVTTNEDDDFDRLFWPNYPRKQGKLEARRAYKRLRVSDQMRVLEDIKIRYKDVQACFIPYPATYLNARRFEDELPAVGIPDPPRPKAPDGGLARRPVEPAFRSAKGVPVNLDELAEDIRRGTCTSVIAPSEARARLANLIQGIGKKL